MCDKVLDLVAMLLLSLSADVCGAPITCGPRQAGEPLR